MFLPAATNNIYGMHATSLKSVRLGSLIHAVTISLQEDIHVTK